MNLPVKRRNRIIIIGAASVALISIIMLLAIGACAIYLGDYYRADIDAIQAFLPQDTEIAEPSDGTIVFGSTEASDGFIFYPGGKVEYKAYIPLLQALSEKGVLCVLVKMPFNLAVFDINAADGIQEMYPQVKNWYIGGHSLGGSMAASYLAGHTNEYEGLVLLGSYSTANLSETELRAISLFGSEDKVMNRDKYDSSKANLPNDFTEKIIEGGCHAYFGMYGAQDGDGTPTIDNKQQIDITASAIEKWIKDF